MSSSDPAGKAHLRSHSGPFAGVALTGAPTAPEYTIDPLYFRVLLLERLRLPLPLTESQCEGCGATLDVRGRHRAACPRTGRLKSRATPTEVALARICREAGARVRFNAYLRNLNVGVPAQDGRRIEVLASGLPCFHGAQLAVDITLRSVLTADGHPRPNTAEVDGAVADAARDEKEATYPELVAGR